MTVVFDDRLEVTDPAAWRAAAAGWRAWAARVGRWAAELRAHAARLAAVWSGAAATAAVAGAERLRRRLDLFRLLCWQADQALSEFAGALARGRSMLGTAGDAARALAAAADDAAAARLSGLGETSTAPVTGVLPSCAASPAEVRRWWDTLRPDQRRWVLSGDPGWVAALDGVPAADRDLANRLLLDQRRAELDRAVTDSPSSDRPRLRRMRAGLDALADRLADGTGVRAYLLRLDVAGDGRAVVALGDPGRAADVLTHVPGMTADLASYTGELSRAERVAERAAELSPATATSAVLWLDYDAPDFLDEAAGAGRAQAGAPGLRRFQEGLRADGAAHLSVLGHSYGSVLVGAAAQQPGLAADDVVFAGSPGVGVDTAAGLHTGRVWSTTSDSDVIQHLPVAPTSLLADLALTTVAPGAGGLLAFGQPERDLWFGTNPSDPAFGARVFASRPDGGHLGYWDRGSPSLDAITRITVDGDVTPR